MPHAADIIEQQALSLKVFHTNSSRQASASSGSEASFWRSWDLPPLV